ncbi:hypothetical protein [Micromonospora sp. SH-82]|uniref:hypothetical protein n=1 Tax=Micromonospora sp. SH-82 TaxID=3132938 RepID=UPI003EC0367E
MDIVVAQWVRTSWTGQSRDGSQAALRNALPVAFALTEGQATVTHEVTLSEGEEFQPQSVLRRADPSPDTVRLRRSDGDLWVDLVPLPAGRPLRRRRPGAVRVPRGEWLRWQINYRFDARYGAGSHYRFDTLNIAYGSVPLDVFLTEPTRTVDERMHLR